MKQANVFIHFFVPALLCIGLAGAAQDHNSSRSNKTSSIAAPDSGGGAVEMKAKEKANRTKSLTTDGTGDSGPAGMAIDEGGTPKVHKGKKPAARTLSDSSGPAEITIDEGGTPKPKGKKPAALIQDGDPSTTDCDDNDPKRSVKSGSASDCNGSASNRKNGLQDKKNR